MKFFSIPIVLFADTVVEPLTMMIKNVNTSITLAAMLGSWSHMSVAYGTKMLEICHKFLAEILRKLQNKYTLFLLQHVPLQQLDHWDQWRWLLAHYSQSPRVLL